MSRPSEFPISRIGPAATVVALLCAAGAALAAASGDRPDGELVSACANEARDRYFESAGADHIVISSSAVERGRNEEVVRIVLASGEGRTARATCKFRDGKLFDVLNR